MNALDGIRAELERLDRALVVLIGERVRVARQAAAIKRREGVPSSIRVRNAVVRRAAEWARAAGLPEEDMREVFWGLVGLTRRVQRESACGDR
jgi:chorismate mutase